jgi:hypothetical protein
MTIQKQLSHLSFAAIMLVFAALPALAQTGSDNQTAVVTTSSSVEAEQMAAVRAALRKDRVSVPSKESTIVVAPATSGKQPAFSLTQFMKSATEPAVISDTRVLEFTSLEKPAKAFTDSSAKSIQFVPSRGPKLPWQ